MQNPQFKSRQVSKIIGCELKQIGQLGFNHYSGGCANVQNEYVYLCFNFDKEDIKTCRMALSPTGQFEKVAESFYNHDGTRIAASESKKQFLSFLIKF